MSTRQPAPWHSGGDVVDWRRELGGRLSVVLLLHPPGLGV